MKYSFLILVAFIMNACMAPVVTTDATEEITPMKSKSGMVVPGVKGGAIKMQADLTDEPGEHTVQFLIDGPSEDLSAGIRRTTATITWTVEGNFVSRQIDVVNGASISGTAESVAISVEDNSNGPQNLQPYLVSIQVARGSRGSVQQPPYLTAPSVTTAAGIQTATVPVPQAAGAISVYVTVGATPGTVIADADVLVGHDCGGGSLKSYSPLKVTGWVPLASGTTRIDLFTGAGAPIVFWTVTFGIDG